MTITISTKEYFFLVGGAVLLIALGFTVFAFRGDKTESDQPRVDTNSVSKISTEPKTEFSKPTIAIPLTGQPFPNCELRLQGMARSPVPKTTNPYNVAFVTSTNGQPTSIFQDINGDNLPDYLYVYNVVGGNGILTSSSHTACIYLNNGNGWTKAYECKAYTETENQTGNVGTQFYSGDCAQ